MKRCEVSPMCQKPGCTRPTVAAFSQIDANVEGYSPAEAGYRLVAYCWICKVTKSPQNTDRWYQVFVDGDVGRLDFDRAGGGVRCPDCHREYLHHPECKTAPFLTVLCDGSVVKL